MFDARRAERKFSNAKLEIHLAAILLDEDWQSWVFAALAFIYGLGVLIVIIVLLVKSSKIHKR